MDAQPLAAADGVAQLVRATRRGSLPDVARLLEAGASCNAPDRDGFSALWLAAFHGHVHLIRPMQQAGGNLDNALPPLEPPLVSAVRGQRLDTVRALLAAGARPDVITHHGDTPLSVAVRTGGRAAVECLLAGGASSDFRASRWTETPLLLALQRNDATVAGLLLDAGADGTGWGVLVSAVTRAPIVASGLCSRLLKAAPDLDLQDPQTGHTLLMVAVLARNPAAVEAVLAHRVNLYLRSRLNLTALDYAARTGSRTLRARIARACWAQQSATLLLCCRRRRRAGLFLPAELWDLVYGWHA